MDDGEAEDGEAEDEWREGAAQPSARVGQQPGWVREDPEERVQALEAELAACRAAAATVGKWGDGFDAGRKAGGYAAVQAVVRRGAAKEAAKEAEKAKAEKAEAERVTAAAEALARAWPRSGWVREDLKEWVRELEADLAACREQVAVEMRKWGEGWAAGWDAGWDAGWKAARGAKADAAMANRLVGYLGDSAGAAYDAAGTGVRYLRDKAGAAAGTGVRYLGDRAAAALGQGRMFSTGKPVAVQLGGRATKKITRQRDKRSRRKRQRKRRKTQRKRKL